MSTEVSGSSFARVHRVFLLEPTHMEVEDEIRRMRWKMRETVKSTEWRVEEYQDDNTMRMTHAMTCAQHTLSLEPMSCVTLK